MDDQAVNDAVDAMRVFAGQEGFALADVLVEHQWLHTNALDRLVDLCQLRDIRNVVVPTTAHLNTVPALALIAQVSLQQAVDGLVWVAQVTEEEAAEVRALLDARPL
ncbi:hypothetical protein [Streptomyces cinereoruber]|uniref:hypothetical protein n=1 Tax=Streptomyces cinereoruber TaxID=67260 RepID=UPI00362B0778